MILFEQSFGGRLAGLDDPIRIIEMVGLVTPLGVEKRPALQAFP